MNEKVIRECIEQIIGQQVVGIINYLLYYCRSYDDNKIMIVLSLYGIFVLV